MLLSIADRERRVVVEVLVVDDHVDVAHLAELAQLERGELHLHRSAAAEDVHVGHRRRLQPLVDVVGDLGRQQVLGVLRQHPRGVERDVAVADHGDALRRQRPGARVVGVPVVPADEVGGAVAAGQVDARDVEVGVAHGPGREDDGVVVALQVVERDVAAVEHVAEDADVAAVDDFAERRDDALDARMVGRDPVAHEPVGGREALEQVDRDVESAIVFEQDVGGVDAGGSCADDRQTQLHAIPRASVSWSARR